MSEPSPRCHVITRGARTQSMTTSLLLVLAGRAMMDAEKESAARCRDLLSRMDSSGNGLPVAELEWQRLSCDAIMLHDTGSAQMIVGHTSQPPTPSDDAAPCRRLLESMDQIGFGAEQAQLEFERAKCAKRLLSDRGRAQVLL